MTVDLTLLGAFAARCGDTAVTLPTRKAQALLAYLALVPERAHEREKLCGLLWGETGRDQAYSSLRQTLFSIRKALPPALKGAIVANGRTVSLDPSQVQSDVSRFEQLLRRGPVRAELEQVALLYKGPLLDGFAVGEAPFEEWLSAERSRFSELASSALGKLALLQLEEGAPDRALQTRLALLRLEPWDEENHRALMQLYARLGRRSAAIAQYQQCVTLLERELGIEPEPATRKLYEEIAGLDATLDGAPDAPAAVIEKSRARAGVPETAQKARSGAAPLVGRDAELTRLVRGLDDAWSGRAGVSLLVGEAGVGKTRLLEELLTLASARGGTVIRGRCFESEQILPFAPWVEALRGERALSDLALRDRLTPALRAELSRLLPWGEQSASAEIPSQENALRLLEAVLELLSKLAERAPLLLVLDDLQWADDMSLRLFSFLGRRLSGATRIFIAASLRGEELSRSSFLATAIGELARDGCSFRLAVEPLSQAETATLAHSLTVQDPARLDARVHEQIWSLSEGNPFVVVEAVRALAEGALDAKLELPVPARVREVIAGHVQRLPALEQRLVAVAAVIGREFEFALLCKAAECDDEAGAAAVDELSRVGVFKASGDKLYFAHERIREVVYEGLLPPRRTVLHGHVARALCALHADALHEIYGRLAFHYGKADDPRAAVTYLTRFAEGAARSFGLNEALAALADAGVFTERLPQSERAEWRVEVAVRRAKCLFHLGHAAEIVSGLEPHLPALDTLARQDLVAQVHFWLGCANGMLGNMAEAASAGERALAAALRGNGVKAARRAHTLLAWEAAFAARFQKGIEHGLSATVSLSPADAEPEYIASGWMTAGVNYLYVGRHREAFSALSQACALAQAASVPRVTALALGLTGLAYAETEQPEAALKTALSALALAPDPVSSAATLSMLVHVHVRAGRADEALQLVRPLISEDDATVRPNESGSLLALAEAYLLKRDLTAARRAAERALITARAAGHPLIVGGVLRVLGQVAFALGELSSARDTLDQARELLVSIGGAFQLGRCLCAQSSVALALGDTPGAAAYLEQAEELYRGLALEALSARVAEALAALRQPTRAAAT